MNELSETDRSVKVRKRAHADPLQNRSLERGIEILRAFRPGLDLLGNGELAERTGLSRATVSRLTQTLAGTGILEHDRRARAYRLAAPVLCFAHAMRSCNPVLQVASPLMRAVAEKLHVNVGLATADRDEMVYLESVRYNRKVSLRSVVAGQRVPIELTSLGRAYLSAVEDGTREEVLALIRARKPACWDKLDSEIQRSIESVRTNGYCAVSWQPEVVALSVPIVLEAHPTYVMNMSVTTQESIDSVSAELAPALLALQRKTIDGIKY
ncbi:MAG: IclR family transcriptional regulator [Rhodocyclaceae bacterium]